LEAGKSITAETLRNAYLGIVEKGKTILEVFQYHNSQVKQLINQDFSIGTYEKYCAALNHTEAFIQWKFKVSDLEIKNINYEFITEFEFFLRRCKPLSTSNPLTNNGIMKHLERLKKMVTLAVKMEWIPKDPFERYQLRFQKVERDFLTKEELSRVESYSMAAKLERARDMFVFSCYTGLSYIDLVNLSAENISIGIDGEYWIRTSRQKTDVAVNIPLLPAAKSFSQEFSTHDSITRTKQS
jgi:integrase